MQTASKQSIFHAVVMVLWIAKAGSVQDNGSCDSHIQCASKVGDHFENVDSKLNFYVLKLLIICHACHRICSEKKNLSLIRKLQKHFHFTVVYLLSFPLLSNVSLPASHLSEHWLSHSCGEIFVCVCEYFIQIHCCRSDQCANAWR